MSPAYAGLVRTGKREALAVPGPHLLVSGPTGVGKSRRVLAPAAAMWQGPAVVVSSKDDLMQLVHTRRAPEGEAYVLDLRPVSGEALYPPGITRVRIDPTALICDQEDAVRVAELLIACGSVGMGGSSEDVTDAGLWDSQAVSPLAAILFAASPVGLGGGITWALAAVDSPHKLDDDDPFSACWPNAVAVCEDDDEHSPHARRLARVLGMEDRQRDSVAMNMQKALTPWLREAVRGGDLPPWDPAMLDVGKPVLHILAPADGTAAGAAVGLLDDLVNRWRGKTAALDRESSLLLCIDELPNTAPLPKLTTYVGEARGLGVTIIAAVQATVQLERKYGPAQLRELRSIFPSTLVMYGAPEREMLDAAAWWMGRTERRSESYDPGGGGNRQHSVSVEAVVEGVDLIPGDDEHARLLLAGGPGQLVEIPDWSVVWDRLFALYEQNQTSSRKGRH